ncbi:hypothetical protein ACLB2K_025152 [Fragaria x ananassa]
MDFKLCLVALLLALAVAVEAAKLHDASWGLARYNRDSSLIQANVGDVIGEDNEMMLDSESSRRTLAGRTRYISYGALKRNRIPCRRRGASYYNCGRPNQQANTYRRVHTDLVETSTFCSGVELRIAPPSFGHLPAQGWCSLLPLAVPDIFIASNFMEERC